MSARTKRALSTAGIIVLGPAGAALVLLVIPDAFGIEWFCLFEGPTTKAADHYLAVAAIATAASWLALVVGTICAHRAGLANLGLALPPAWFVLIVASSIVVAAAIGSQPCQGDGLFIF
jgi:hypothetical protein